MMEPTPTGLVLINVVVSIDPLALSCHFAKYSAFRPTSKWGLDVGGKPVFRPHGGVEISSVVASEAQIVLQLCFAHDCLASRYMSVLTPCSELIKR